MSERAKILIIEDDKDTVEAMKVTLEAQDFQVLSSHDPQNGYNIALEKKPNLIILDVMFGKKEKTEGFDYALKMKQDKDLAPIPILMITAVNIRHPEFHYSTETDGKYLPVDEFIDKPVQPDDLIKKVKKLLDIKVSKWKNWPHEQG